MKHAYWLSLFFMIASVQLTAQETNPADGATEKNRHKKPRFFVGAGIIQSSFDASLRKPAFEYQSPYNTINDLDFNGSTDFQAVAGIEFFSTDQHHRISIRGNCYITRHLPAAILKGKTCMGTNRRIHMN